MIILHTNKFQNLLSPFDRFNLMILGIPPNRVQNHACYVSIKELIEDKVLSQWVDYLKKKFVNEDKETGITPRSDTVWKKIFRDLREFFRILFKSRFHPLDYKLKTYLSLILFYSPVPVTWDMQAYRFSENSTIIKPMTVLNTENKNSKGRKRKQALGMLHIC